MSDSGTCSVCGGPAPRHEIRDDLRESWRRIIERTPLVCSMCVERENAERRSWEREQSEREHCERVRARRVASGIPERLRGLTWEHIADTPAELLATAEAWAVGETAGLLLTSPVGVGKTWFAAAAAWARLEYVRLRWFAVPALFAQLGLAFGDERRGEALDALTGSCALVLDDIDKARPTEYGAEQILCAVEGRVNAGGSLLVTTNLSLSALAARYPEPYGEPIVSRLAGYCETYALDGHDRRLEGLAV